MRYTTTFNHYRNRHIEVIRYKCSNCAQVLDYDKAAEHIIKELPLDVKSFPSTYKSELREMFKHGYKIDLTRYSEPKKYNIFIKNFRNNTKMLRMIKCSVCAREFKSAKTLNLHKKETHSY